MSAGRQQLLRDIRHRFRGTSAFKPERFGAARQGCAMRSERKPYMRTYQSRWARNRRDAWLAANGPCKLCGSAKLLEVDHVDPTAKVTHRVWSWSLTRREPELRKCQVLCRSCHQRKTAAYLGRITGKAKSNPMKLTEGQVLEIHAAVKAGKETHRVIAARYGVAHSTVTYIGNGRLWAWLTTPAPVKPEQLGLFAGAA